MPAETFAEMIKRTATTSKKSDNFTNMDTDQNSRMESIKDTKFKFLTEKYFENITRGIKNAAEKGFTEKYINFEYEDFKANCVGLGNPQAFQELWLKEMSDINSKYLPYDKNEDNKISLYGIEFEIIGNYKFTTKFSW